MKPILKIVAICVICAATLMSGGADPVHEENEDCVIAANGTGLSDKEYASWITSMSKSGQYVVVENPQAYLMGMVELGTPVTWAGKPGYTVPDIEGCVTQMVDGYVVTGDTGLTAYEFAAKYQQVGVSDTGEKMYILRGANGGD